MVTIRLLDAPDVLRDGNHIVEIQQALRRRERDYGVLRIAGDIRAG
jgi:hypothetical protein